MKRDEIKILEGRFDKMSNFDQWKFALEHRSEIAIRLDNDDTYFYFESDSEAGPVLFTFNDYMGSGNGCYDLLVVLGFSDVN